MVTGSEQYKLKVVKDQPGKRFLLAGTLLFLFVVSVAGSYLFGVESERKIQQGAAVELLALKKDFKQLSKEKVQLEQEVANAQTGAKVEQLANENVRQEIMMLKETIAKLEEDNSFYRNLMAPQANKKGLTIGAVEISKAPSANSYSFEVVMQQFAKNHNLLKGDLYVTINGRLDGQNVNYALSDLSQEIASEIIKLRFKYFQTVKGEINLPTGFEPEHIHLVANSTGKKASRVEKKLAWLVEEA